MNTNALKAFAREARKSLRAGVENRLSYWGFDLNSGKCTEILEPIAGGYIFRGDVGDGARIPQLWQALRKRVRDAQAVRDVAEEAAYTWFNRLMAIRILEKNGYISPTLSFAEGSAMPLILQNARLGLHDVKGRQEQVQLQQYLLEDKDEQAFALLLRHLCNQNPLIRQVFGRLDDFTDILLPDNLLSKNGILQHINNSEAITDDDFKQVELIGWLYQFYIADRKDEVFAGFKKNQKARAEDIPAATQIFTPRWIVRYMVENTVGRIWLDHNKHSILRGSLPYLVEAENVENTSNTSNPLITNHLPLITQIEDLKLLDPACGSGHILVEGFELLFKIYHEDEGFSKREAAKSILKNNLFGLDIDERAAQLAQFAVMLKAAQRADVSLLNADILPNIHAMPAPYDFSDDQILTFLGENTEGSLFEETKAALDALQQGRNIGSALVINLADATRTHLHARLNDLTNRPLTFMEESVLPRIKPFIEVILMLADRFEAIAANPPYMGSGTMNDTLKMYINQNYPLSKNDLFAVFMDVATQLLKPNARYGMINQHSWMFLSSFEGLRKKVLQSQHIENMLHLGPRTFDELSGEVVQSTAFVIKNTVEENAKGTYFRLVEYRNSDSKHQAFLNRNNKFTNVQQINFDDIPSNQFAYWVSPKSILIFKTFDKIKSIGTAKQGLITGDNDRFLRFWFEVSTKEVAFIGEKCKRWFMYVKGGSFRKWFGNNELIVNWQNHGFEIKNFYDSSGKLRSRPQSISWFYKEGMTWSSLAMCDFSARFTPKNYIFDAKGSMLFTENSLRLPYLISLFNSKISNHFLEVLAPTVDFGQGAVSSLPFILDINSEFEIEALFSNCVDISRTDWNAHETSWDFEISPLLQGTSLRDAYAKWEQAATTAFWQLHGNEERLNALFIDIYGLGDELTPSVSPSDVTILQSELKLKNVNLEIGGDLPINRKEVMAQFLNFLIGCLMGRYRLDKTGLHIAHANAAVEDHDPYTFRQITDNSITNNEFEIDEDGIVPMMGRYSPFADDVVGRVKTVLQQLWGEAVETDNLNFLNDCLEEPFEEWLTNPKKHWDWHKKQYHRKPIYWLFASSTGKDAAFKALVYQHRLTRHTVGTLLNKYVLKHLQYLREESDRLRNLDKTGKSSKEDLKLLQKFERDIVECEKYVEVLKPLSDTEIDLDDGVTVNYEKFGKAVIAL